MRFKMMIWLSMFSSALLFSCSNINPDEILKSHATTKEGYYFVGHSLIGNKYVASLYTVEEEPFMGYTQLFVELTDLKGNTIKDAPLKFFPLMKMGNMEHSCPYVEIVYNDALDMFEGVAVFSMKHQWEIQLSVNGAETEIPMMVYHSKDNPKFLDVYTGKDRELYSITRVIPEKFVKGKNETVFLINHQKDFMNFPALEEIELIGTILSDSLTKNDTLNRGKILFENKTDGFFSANLTLRENDSLILYLVKERDTIVETIPIDCKL